MNERLAQQKETIEQLEYQVSNKVNVFWIMNLMYININVQEFKSVSCDPV